MQVQHFVFEDTDPVVWYGARRRDQRESGKDGSPVPGSALTSLAEKSYDLLRLELKAARKFLSWAQANDRLAAAHQVLRPTKESLVEREGPRDAQGGT